MTDEQDVEDLRDDLADLEARFEALNRARVHFKDRVEELEHVVDVQAERLADLEQLVDPDPGSIRYEQLSKEQKVYRVRKALVEDAARSGGTAALHYDDVKWLFDGHPSPGHCYDLMKRAAELDGFAYDTPNGEGGQKRIRVNLDGVNDETLVHAANNVSTEEAP